METHQKTQKRPNYQFSQNLLLGEVGKYGLNSTRGSVNAGDASEKWNKRNIWCWTRRSSGVFPPRRFHRCSKDVSVAELLPGGGGRLHVYSSSQRKKPVVWWKPREAAAPRAIVPAGVGFEQPGTTSARWALPFYLLSSTDWTVRAGARKSDLTPDTRTFDWQIVLMPKSRGLNSAKLDCKTNKKKTPLSWTSRVIHILDETTFVHIFTDYLLNCDFVRNNKKKKMNVLVSLMSRYKK